MAGKQKPQTFQCGENKYGIKSKRGTVSGTYCCHETLDVLAALCQLGDVSEVYPPGFGYVQVLQVRAQLTYDMASIREG